MAKRTSVALLLEAKLLASFLLHQYCVCSYDVKLEQGRVPVVAAIANLAEAEPLRLPNIP